MKHHYKNYILRLAASKSIRMINGELGRPAPDNEGPTILAMWHLYIPQNTKCYTDAIYKI